jgi:hypothetical protein
MSQRLQQGRAFDTQLHVFLHRIVCYKRVWDKRDWDSEFLSAEPQFRMRQGFLV